MPQTQYPAFLITWSWKRNILPTPLPPIEADLLSFADFISANMSQDDLREVNYPQVRSWIVQLVEQGLSNNSINRKFLL